MTANALLNITMSLADADMQAAVPAALARAALRASELAARTGTPLVVSRDGQLIEADSHPPKDGQSPVH
jgi:hypothetical protein